MRRPRGVAVPALRVIATAAFIAAVTSAGRASQSAGGERAFAGNWSATGTRQTIAAEDNREAAVVMLSGSIVLAPSGGLATGFRGQAIGFDDGRGMATGRAVWTDVAGNRIFSELRGDPLATGRRIAGTITGGTGRYQGITGSYELTWQYVVRGEDDTVQGRAVDLRGRVRLRGGAP